MNERPAPAKPATSIAADRAGRPAPPTEGEAAELAAALQQRAAQNPLGFADPVITRAAALLQRHEAELATLRRQQSVPPAEGEVGELVAWLQRTADLLTDGNTQTPRLSRTAEVLQRQAEELAVLRQLAEEILALVSESDGVAGLHLNGEVAPWDELLPGGRFERLTSLPSEERTHA